MTSTAPNLEFPPDAEGTPGLGGPEREPFLTHYRQFRFAFPDRRSAVVETAAERELALLRALFDHREACKITHPYPCDLGVLGDAVAGAASDSSPTMPAAAS